MRSNWVLPRFSADACQRDPESRTGKGSKRRCYPTNRCNMKLKRVLREGRFAEGRRAQRNLGAFLIDVPAKSPAASIPALRVNT